MSDLKKAFHFLGEELTICYADPLLPANIRWGRKFYLAAGEEKIHFLDALASLDLKLSVSESVSNWYFLDLQVMQVMQVKQVMQVIQVMLVKQVMQVRQVMQVMQEMKIVQVMQERK